MKQTGFTLVELLVVVAIVSVIVGWGIPGMTGLVKETRKDRYVGELFQLIQLTRQTAISKGATAVLCPTKDGVNCQTNWNLPLMVFHDRNRNKVLDEGEPLIASAPSNSEITIKFSAFGGTKGLRYYSTGMTFNQNGSFTVCPADKDETFGAAVIINRGGRAYLGIDKNNTGVVDLPSGRDISCG